jgi:23S rRNA (guanosine2251-2'-O)-methyltransferase
MIIILDNLRSALNVGSVIRTCDALGIRDVYFCGITPSPENSKVLKTSLGAEKNVVAHVGHSTFETAQKLKRKGIQIIALELTEGAVDVDNFEPSPNCALVIGNEVSGVSHDILALADQVAMIPMKGTKESLNVAVAFGIAAYTLVHKKGL